MINTDILERLISAKLRETDWAVLMEVINRTWGFQKLSDRISLTTFEKNTGYTRQGVVNALSRLKKRRILVINRSVRIVNERLLPNEILFNKHYDTWIDNSQRAFTKSTGVDHDSQQALTRDSQQDPQKIVNGRLPSINSIDKYIDNIINIVGFMNDEFCTAYKNTSVKTRKLIVSRLKEGFTEEDFKTVITNMNAEWKNDPKMCAFLRPETIFSNKFESYLNRISKPKPKKSTFVGWDIEDDDGE